MTFQELDVLRYRLQLSCKHVCVEAGINPTTYTRWMKWARSEPGGSRPHPRSLKALRDVLKQSLQSEDRPAA